LATAPSVMGPSSYDAAAARSQAKAFFEDLWANGDPWELDATPLDQARYRRQFEMLADRRYSRALEVGCGAGSFTERLLPLTDSIVALDIAQPALERAKERLAGDAVTFRLLDVMDLDPVADGPWEVVVIAETIYYLGWLHPMFDVAWLLHVLHQATSPGGRLLLSDTISHDHGLMSSWLIRAYRDLARNVGYQLERSEVLEGTKYGVDFSVALDLFGKALP
jgi:2-polyprenyl-3-methyl-5-hydroxy-6-metoxy-1,4-benzoquinol methylase